MVPNMWQMESMLQKVCGALLFVVMTQIQMMYVYEPIDVAAGKRAGTVGLPQEEVGLYMEVPQQGIMCLNPAH